MLYCFGRAKTPLRKNLPPVSLKDVFFEFKGKGNEDLDNSLQNRSTLGIFAIKGIRSQEILFSFILASFDQCLWMKKY
ncbi:hypothetical protein CMV_029650 [Castanea mollissima]|uniref:Uncharacterized protein n=1 Tax=Castanea mollissima TaxID=60419 RepID=A0A8J4VD80_9ROSI|nr:hypothetical protein CMV_029650 [Castanea mollissima]